MVEVRAETAADAAGIRALHCAAFPTPAEADLVDRLRTSGEALVSLVAAEEDRVIGHVLFSRIDAEADDRVVAAMGLAPVAVLPDHQAQGIGSALIRAGLRLAESRGVDIVFVVGEPGYYRRFGFDAAAAAPFASPYAGPHLQALVLGPDFQLPKRGRADYPAAFAGLE